MSAPRIFLSVGDLSGDQNCALLVAELLKRHPNWQIFALGGIHTRNAGAQILADTSHLGVIGLSSALATLPRTLAIANTARGFLKNNRVDAAILCDWGGFNTRILPAIQTAKIPSLYYFPPRSWQKEGSGGLQIAAQVHKIATPFPWSARRLNDAGGDAVFVGHPILEMPSTLASRQEIRARLGVSPDEKLLALLPGSRALELKYIAPHIVGALDLLSISGLKPFVAAASGTGDKVRAIFGARARVLENQSLELLRACDAAVVKSGTSTLEAAALGAPFVVVYEVPALLHMQIKLTGLDRQVPFVGMPNIIAGRAIVPELLGQNCRAPHIAREIQDLLCQPLRGEKMRAEFQTVRETLGANLPYTATAKTADLVEEILKF